MSRLRRFERARRYVFETPVRVGVGRHGLSVMTRDVGANGMFVRSQTQAQLRQLVTLDVTLGFDLGDLQGHGMIVHVVPRAFGSRTPGMGIALYGLDDAHRDRWAAFIKQVRASAPLQRARTLVAAKVAIMPPEAIRRRYAAFRDVLEIRTDLVQDLVTMFECDLPQGGISLQTDEPMAVGQGFVLRIVHPRRRDSLNVPCRVRRLIQDESMHGIDAEFLDLDDNARALFWAFIGAEVADLEDGEVVVVDEGPSPA